MKKLTYSFIFIILASFSQIANAEIGMLYSAKGYPYKNLIHRADEIKIFYTQKTQNVECRVEVQVAGSTWKPSQHSVQKEDFEQEPLASCLPREVAKQILASTFSS